MASCTDDASVQHAAHRLYVWTADRGVVAIPDFDRLGDFSDPESDITLRQTTRKLARELGRQAAREWVEKKQER